VTTRFFRTPLPWRAYTAQLDLTAPPGVDPPEGQWNIAPMSFVPVIRCREYTRPGHEMPLMLWSLVPQWWREPLTEKRWTSFNARVEDVAESAVFRGAYRYRRCLVPASGFYVWSGAQGRRVPYAVGVPGADVFCMGGVWERWGFDGAEIDTFAILTTPANDRVAAHSERMPLILPPERWARWLDHARMPDPATLTPWPAERTEDWPAHPDVGNVRAQGEEMPGERPPHNGESGASRP